MPYSASCLPGRIIQDPTLFSLLWNPFRRTGFEKKPPPGAFAGRGVNAVIRDGAAISGGGEGAPSVGAICSQIKITNRATRGRKECHHLQSDI